MSTSEQVVIIGSGPAGCTAAVYACRAELQPVLVTGPTEGGQLTEAAAVENWPGLAAPTAGAEIMRGLLTQAGNLGARIRSDRVVAADLKGAEKSLTLASGDVLRTRSVILATGAAPRALQVPGEDTYRGHGVSSCAVCDGFFFRGRPVAVVGGGAAAFAAALYLARLSPCVYLVHRRETFKAERVQQTRLQELAAHGQVKPVLNARVEEIIGDGRQVTGLRVCRDGAALTLAVSGVFLAVGHTPATDVFAAAGRDAHGYVRVGRDGGATATAVPGVFAAGDCCNPQYRQAVVAAGQGCMAAYDAQNYLLSARV